MQQFHAIIQVRFNSNRLPGKSFMPIDQDGRETSLLDHLVFRLKKIGLPPQNMIIAFPKAENKMISRLIHKYDVRYFAGDDDDVLMRFIEASTKADDEDHIIRLTGDNPFIDYDILIKNMKFALKKLPELTYPDQLPLGMGFEICKVKTMRGLLSKTLSASHKEHVTTYIKQNHHSYNILPLRLERSVYPIYKNIRLTVDEIADLRMARKTFQYFCSQGKRDFTSIDVLQLYRQYPDFFADNLHIKQKIFTIPKRQDNSHFAKVV